MLSVELWIVSVTLISLLILQRKSQFFSLGYTGEMKANQSTNVSLWNGELQVHTLLTGLKQKCKL